MSKANLNAAKQRGDTSAVRGQVGEVPSHQRGRGDGSFEHTNEGVAIDGLDHLQRVMSEQKKAITPSLNANKVLINIQQYPD